MYAFLAVFIFGGLGATARYGIYTALRRPAFEHFPYATVTVNVVGSLLIGLLGAVLASRMPDRVILREAVLIGFLGGFTTFSAFSAEALRLVHGGESGKAMLHVALNVALCLGAVWAGHALGTLFAPLRSSS